MDLSWQSKQPKVQCLLMLASVFNEMSYLLPKDGSFELAKHSPVEGNNGSSHSTVNW